MVQVWDELARAINRDLSALHISRDAYLNGLFKQEIEELAAEVKFVTPDDARCRIKTRLRGLNPERMTIAIDRDVAKRMKQVFKEKNVLRDSFVNRVFFFLVAKPAHLKRLDIEYRWRQDVEVKPLGDAGSFLHDPFYNIRDNNNGRFYTLTLPDVAVAKKLAEPLRTELRHQQDGLEIYEYARGRIARFRNRGGAAMNTMHLQKRMQQRSIPPLVIDWLENFGDETYDHHGAVILHFSKRAKRRLEKAVGREPVSRMTDWLRAYMIVSTDGTRITAGMRYRRINR